MKALLAVGLIVALAACQPKPDGTSNVKQNFEVVCAGADLGYLLYQGFQGKIKPTLALKVEASYATIKVICTNPPADTTEALIVALRAVSVFNRELATAKAAVDDHVS